MTEQLNTRDFLIDTGKEAMEAQAADGDEFMPTLIVEHPDHTHDVMLLLGGHPYDLLTAIVPTLREVHPVSLGLTVDSYMLVSGDDPEGALARRQQYGNSLQRMHEAGEPGVSECLVIHLATPTSAECIQLPYVRHHNVIEWSPEHVLPGDANVSGRMVEVLRAVWT